MPSQIADPEHDPEQRVRRYLRQFTDDLSVDLIDDPIGYLIELHIEQSQPHKPAWRLNA